MYNANTKSTYEGDSRLAIELLFKDVPELVKCFAVDPNDRAGWIKFVGDKVHFAEQVVPGLDKQHFEVFRPVFDFVQSKIT